MKKFVLAGAMLALAASTSASTVSAMPRPTALATPSVAQSANLIDHILGMCPGLWVMVKVMPGATCKPTFSI